MTPKPPVLRGEAFHELRRSPEISTAAREPSVTAPVFGLPRSSCPGLPRSSSFASFCGRKRFFKNCGAPSQLKKCENLGPLALFSKNCLTLFVSGREKKRAFSCALSVLAKIFFGPKQCKAGSTIKIGVSAEIAKKQN